MNRHRTLLIGAGALLALPFAMLAMGLSISTATQVVAFSIAALGLNLLVGYTGLTSFGHAAWFGIGAYAAGLAQKHWFEGQLALPLLFSVAFVALLSLVVGMLILRRRGVYFALLTLAFVALTYAIAFRWTALTGGEDGLGGLKRGGIAAIPLDNGAVYYALVALLGLGVLFLLLRVTRSPFGHVLVAIRENQQRAMFQGYDVDRYRLGAFVLSATVTGLGGALLGFLHYLVSAEAVSVVLSGELLAMVVIGGMHHMLGPALGVLFYVLFRELLSIWTGNWLLWFGLVFVGFVIFSPEGLAGIWAKLRRRWNPPPEESAAMSRRRIYEGLPLPAFLRSSGDEKDILQYRRHPQAFRRHPRGRSRQPDGARGRNPCADRAERRRQDDAVQRRERDVPARCGRGAPVRQRGARPAALPHLPAGARALVPDHQPVQGAVDLREPAPVAAGAGIRRASTPGATSTATRRCTRRPGNCSSSSAWRASRRSPAAISPTAGSGSWISASRSAPSRACCCSMSRWRAWPPPSASAYPAW